MNKKESSFKIGIYIRVSTEEQAENPEGSIKSQECRLREYVKHRNSFESFGEIEELYCDAGISAKDTNRPSFQRMMDDVRQNKIDMILITELSRLTRSIRDFANLVELFDELGCKIHSIKDQFDSSTAVGSFSMYLMANLAQFERKQVGERITANFLSRSKRGLYNGGCVPLGYKVSGKKDGRLDLVPDEAETVREIFKTFLSEGTLASTTRTLNSREIQLNRKREGGGRSRVGRVLQESLYKMLTNKVYLGIKVYKENGSVQETEAQWEPIINQEVFDRVSEILKTNRLRKPPSRQRYPYLLSGLLYCQCGSRLTGKSAHGNGGKVPYYEHRLSTSAEKVLGKKAHSCIPFRFQALKLEPVVSKNFRIVVVFDQHAC